MDAQRVRAGGGKEEEEEEEEEEEGALHLQTLERVTGHRQACPSCQQRRWSQCPLPPPFALQRLQYWRP
jgi:hypothetical protein